MSEIVKVATYMGSIIGICTGVLYFFKMAKMIISMNENVNKIPQLIKDVESIKVDLKDNSLETYRLVITNDRMPLDERIECGEKYINAGGNGAVHRLVDELKQQKEDEDYQRIKMEVKEC